MAVSIDPVAKRISLSVRDLAAEAEVRRIGFDRDGWVSYTVGTQVHERILAARQAAHPVYRKEIQVTGTFQIEDWTIELGGRVDGCRAEDTDFHIEEFKTATLVEGRAARLSPKHEAHRRQLLIYCDLWTRLGHRVASAQVVYVDPDSGEEEVVRVEFDPVAQAAATESWLRALLRQWERAAQERARKAVLAESLPFPHAAPRAGQLQIIHAIQDAVQTGGHLLVEAATGAGKTAAALHAGLQNALRAGRQLVFLTSKNLQQAIAVQALEAMNRDGNFRVVQLRAKEKMCANDRVFCHEDVCQYARDYATKMERSSLMNRLATTNIVHTPENIFNASKREMVCPFNVQLELAQNADVIVADYNYVFDPGSALMHLRDEGLPQAILIIDEAHNLPDRIRTIFSPELEEAMLDAAAIAARQLPGNSGKGQGRAGGRQLDFAGTLMSESTLGAGIISVLNEAKNAIQEVASHSLPPEKEGRVEIILSAETWMAIWEKWQPVFFNYIRWKQNHKLFSENDPVVEFHFSLQRFVAVLRLGGERTGGFASTIECRGKILRLAILCLDPAVPVKRIFQKVSATIFLSATLQPFELFQRMLGLEKPRLSQIAVPSPFPRANRRILVLPQVRTNFSVRKKYLPQIAALIAQLDAAHDGNKLVLLPSYDFLRNLVELLPEQARNIASSPARRPLVERLRCQSVDATDKERQALLKALVTPPTGGILCLAVLGGMFAEGVDYPGKLLETVVIVSPGLPQLSFERELLRRHFDESSGNGFEYAYLQPGMTRVIQAAGRLIRSETDRGVIALICGRFLEEPYSDRLPRDWYEHSPRELISTNPAADIVEFFGMNELLVNEAVPNEQRLTI